MRELPTIGQLDEDYEVRLTQALGEKSEKLRRKYERYFEEIKGLVEENGDGQLLEDKALELQISYFESEDLNRQVIRVFIGFGDWMTQYSVYRWGLSEVHTYRQPEKQNEQNDIYDCARFHRYSDVFCGRVGAVANVIKERFEKGK